MSSIFNVTTYKDKDFYTSMVISFQGFGIYNYALYANPSELEWQFGAKRKEVSENLVGNFESNFYDDYDVLSVSASTGAFVHPEYGVTHYRREQSDSYKKFIFLLELIKNNYMHYDGVGRPLDVSPVLVNYLGASWLGNFTSFSYREEENTPNNFTLEFEFQVERTLVET